VASSERGLEAVGDPLVVGAEGDGVAALQLEADLVVALAELRRLASHHRLHLAVHPGRDGLLHLRKQTQGEVAHAQREGRVLQERLAAEEDVVAEPVGGGDPHLDAPVGREEAEAGRGGEGGPREGRGDEKRDQAGGGDSRGVAHVVVSCRPA
jgi:hypothetical protein